MNIIKPKSENLRVYNFSTRSIRDSTFNKLSVRICPVFES